MLIAFSQQGMYQGQRGFLFMDVEVLWACILLLKVKIDKLEVYSLAAFGVFASIIFNYLGGLGFFLRSIFVLIATCMMIAKGKNNLETEPNYSYLAPCMVIVSLTTIWIGINDQDIKCYYVKSLIMILTLALLEFTETMKVEQFQEYIATATDPNKKAGGFSKI